MDTARYISEVVLKRDIDQNSYLYALPAVQHLLQHQKLSLQKNITFFVGENGTGKSTLLEAIAVAFGFNPEGGSRNFVFSTRDTHSELWKSITLVKHGFPKDGFFLRAESLYNVATNIDQMDSEPSFDLPIIEGYGGVSLHNQSHGESFLAIVTNRFAGKGLYILDEPEAALSPMRLLTLMTEIHSLVRRDSQFIIATHSPILMTMPNSEILEFSNQGIRRVNYQDTAHFQVTKAFLDAPERMLHYLLSDDEDVEI